MYSVVFIFILFYFLTHVKMIYKAVGVISATILPLLINYFLKQRHEKELKEIRALKDKPDDYYYHCIFWTMENAKCREHMYSNTECGDNCSVVLLQTLVKLIAAAKLSIALCMYHLTLKQITDELINARSRGVVVQIITDSVTVKMEHSKIKLLKHKCGFDVRTPSYKNSFMHHKYCVIDATDLNLRKMFLGSLNLTLQGCVANFEFVVITNNPQMIQHYNDEFQLLWNDFEDSENNTL